MIVLAQMIALGPLQLTSAMDCTRTVVDRVKLWAATLIPTRDFPPSIVFRIAYAIRAVTQTRNIAALNVAANAETIPRREQSRLLVERLVRLCENDTLLGWFTRYDAFSGFHI